MSKTGYVIAKNKGLSAFFTSTSSYDRPKWIAVNEARVYLTAELAESAARKLYSYGAYEARVIPLQEAIELEMPDEDVAITTTSDDQDKDEMVAMVQGNDSEQIHQGDETPGVEGAVDAKLGIADQADRQAIDVALDAEEDAVDQAEVGALDAEEDLVDDELTADASVAGGPDGAPIFRESETMPNKPPLDAKPSDNKTTAIDLPEVPKIKYNNPSVVDDECPTKSGAWPNGATVKTPANVLKDLKDAIGEHEKSAEQSERSNSSRASFCMTVAAAFKDLQQDLEQGTAEGVKAAQIRMTGWMNPITALLPYSVQQFVYLSGRKPSLKQMFDMKKTQSN